MRLLLHLAFLLVLKSAFGQDLTQTFSKTLWCPNDTVELKFSNYPEHFSYAVSNLNTSPGTDACPQLFATLYYGKDSVRLNYHNQLPYAHVFLVNLESPKGKKTFRIHFNNLASFFSDDYMQKNNGGVKFEIPEPFELANIIWTLSPSGEKATDLNKGGEYYKSMLNWFKPYVGHPIFKSLNFPDSLLSNKYYEFRQNSFAYNFADTIHGAKNTKLLFNGPYYYVYGKELADSSAFGKLKAMVEDFAKKSRFRQFYKQNASYYQRQIERQKLLLPVRKMWSWLENEFPKTKYRSYKIVSSPLIGGSHSTQRYATPKANGEWFSENVMFICTTDRYDSVANLSEKQREGLMSGVVFTEIDHNYVNPATNKYAKEIDSIFSRRYIWAKPGNSSDYYGRPRDVFNEYMTHAAFCIYMADSYEKSIADYVIDNRELLMVNRRNFIKFKEFDQELLRLHRQYKDLNMVNLYPMIVAWCKLQQ
jgi:hypothetical protein